ncbi:hypothetical protein [Nocardia tenerifensis]|nr:hypothetical protein [Nocardia tenerifensis]
MMTLVIPLFFVLGVLTAPPVAAEAQGTVQAGASPGVEVAGCTGSFCGMVRPAPLRILGDAREGPASGASAACTGSQCGAVHPAPLRVAVGLVGLLPWLTAMVGPEPLPTSPLDPEFCEYVGPAPFFMSPSDSEFCGLVEPAPMVLSPVAGK